MIVLIFWWVHKNLMLDRFFSDQMAPFDPNFTSRHAEYLGKWRIYLLPKKLELLYSGNCHSKLGDNQSSTSKGFSYFIWWFNFFPNPSPLLYSFQILSPIQSELIHSVKSLNVVHHLKSMYRAQQKMFGRQILRSFAESSGNRKRLPWKSKKGVRESKENHRKFSPYPWLM